MELSDYGLKQSDIERSVQDHLARGAQIERDIEATLAWHRRNWIREMIAHFAPEIDLASMSEEDVSNLVAELEIELDKQHAQVEREE